MSTEPMHPQQVSSPPLLPETETAGSMASSPSLPSTAPSGPRLPISRISSGTCEAPSELLRRSVENSKRTSLEAWLLKSCMEGGSMDPESDVPGAPTANPAEEFMYQGKLNFQGNPSFAPIGCEHGPALWCAACVLPTLGRKESSPCLSSSSSISDTSIIHGLHSASSSHSSSTATSSPDLFSRSPADIALLPLAKAPGLTGVRHTTRMRGPLSPLQVPSAPRAYHKAADEIWLLGSQEERKEEAGSQLVEAKGDMFSASLSFALELPYALVSAAASTVTSALQYSISVLEDEDWDDGSSCSDAPESEDEELLAVAEGLGSAPATCLSTPMEAVKRSTLGKTVVCQEHDGEECEEEEDEEEERESWNEVLQKRQAKKALTNFLDRPRSGPIEANRMFPEKAEICSAPLWQRRAAKAPTSLDMSYRKPPMHLVVPAPCA